jgi:hypothetical protein
MKPKLSKLESYGQRRNRLIGYAWHGCEQADMRMVTHRPTELPDDLYSEAFIRAKELDDVNN